MTDEEIIHAAVARCGGTVRALARVLGVKPITAYQWRNRKRLTYAWRLYLSEKLADPAWPK
jgi:transposase-like protein